MALTKQQLLDAIEVSCEQQGTVAVPGPILKELVENYIPVISEESAIADIATPATATAEDVAIKLNTILAVMRTNGLIAT